MSVGDWPGGAAGAVSLTFDNLGEAAELELGSDPAQPIGQHPSATRQLPAVLEALAGAGLRATFFVEGMNAEVYPDLLRRIQEAGHEVGYHAWRHEQWGALPAGEQQANLARGLAAFEALGLDVAGMRPPGGELGAGGVRVLREAGLRYCSPLGGGASIEDGVAVLPFEWSEVDAASVLPGLGPERGPAEFAEALVERLSRLRHEGGHLSIVLHPFMLDWLGPERLADLLELVADYDRRGELCVENCGRLADGLLSGP
jgi:peptidoglycan/xylan/chitin deacetylase (PgdA/CDA1 family)